MKILAVIANFGTKNDTYLQRLLAEYRSMPHSVDVVLLCNVDKSYGTEVEVVVRQPVGDPWTFPFAHKEILANRLEDYDLFIYSEDDTLITSQNVAAFVAASEIIKEDEVPGFLRSEQDGHGNISISTVHGPFHWDPESVTVRGNELFAFFTNEHSAAYILTKAQLRRAIASGGFLVAPHQSKYDLLVTAATDPYTQCGLKKMVCISRIDEFVLPHLPNRYVGQLGITESLFRRQLIALRSIYQGQLPATTLLPNQRYLDGFRFAKSYYEPSRPELMSLIPVDAESILSYGCGWGAIERDLCARGSHVTAIPLDSVIGTCAEQPGLEVLRGDFGRIVEFLSSRQFDSILVSNMLHLSPDPIGLLSWLCRLLSERGVLVATVPNLSNPAVLWRRLKRDRQVKELANLRRAGVQQTSYGQVRKWFKKAGLATTNIVPTIPGRAQGLYRAGGRLAARWLASEFVVSATKERLSHSGEKQSTHREAAALIAKRKGDKIDSRPWAHV